MKQTIKIKTRPLIFIAIQVMAKFLYSMEDIPINNYISSIDYLYPQRFLQRVICLAKEIHRDLEELCFQNGYMLPLVREIYVEVCSLKKAVQDLFNHSREKDMYLHEDIKFIADFVRDIDRGLLASIDSIDLFQNDVLNLVRAHNEIYFIYQQLVSLLANGKEISIQLEAPIDIDSHVSE